MSGVTSTGPISLPIDFLDVGLLKNRSYKPLGMIIVPDSSEETPESLVQKVQTSAYRQLKELRDIKPDDIRIFVKGHWSIRGKSGYVDRLHFPDSKVLENLINRSRTMNVALQVEVWAKGDTSSPSEYYKQSQQGSSYLDTSRDAFAKILQVEAIKSDEAIHTKEGRVIADKQAPIKKIAVRLLTSHCVRAFRKDLDRRILDANAIVDVKAYKVDVFFKKYQTVVVPGMRSVKESKDVFEEHVFRAIETAKPLKIQYRIKRISPVEKSVPLKKEVETPVEVKEKRTTPLSFGQSAAFGRQPASTSPPAVALPSIGSAFDAFIRSEPLRMINDNTGPSLFKTLHEGFYEAVRQASEVQATTQPSAVSLAKDDADGSLLEAKKPMPFASSTKSDPKMEAAEPVIADLKAKGKAKDPEASNKKDGLRQVEALLTSFMINLNKTLIDNFGDDASTLSILHDDEAPVQSGKAAPASNSTCNEVNEQCCEPKPSCTVDGVRTKVRHNASCNLCNHGIIGTRFKCTICPDWDCCSNCKGAANLLHPGHGLMTIDTLGVLPNRIRPRDWTMHPGIMCDGCDESIVGPRFKCIACEDFDWCVNCEADPSMVHEVGEGHYFLKIDEPIQKRSNFPHVLAQAHDMIHCMNNDQGSRMVKEEDVTLVNLTQPESKEKSGSAEENLSDVQKMLEALSCEAQKLPGADLLAANSPIKPAASTFKRAVVTVEDEEDGYEKADYDMLLVKDVTIPDGTLVMAGSQFQKSWLVQNIGKLAWPTSTVLRVTSSSNALNSGKVIRLLEKPLAPQESIEIYAKDLQAGEELGQQHVYFRLEVPNVNRSIEGKRFGQQLWCQVQVVDGSGAGSRSGSNSGSAFLSASGHKSVDGQQWDQQDASLSSSFFQPPKAPDGEAPSSEGYTFAISDNDREVKTGEVEDIENVSFASSHGGDEDGDDDEYEIVDPTTEGEDSDSNM